MNPCSFPNQNGYKADIVSDVQSIIVLINVRAHMLTLGEVNQAFKNNNNNNKGKLMRKDKTF